MSSDRPCVVNAFSSGLYCCNTRKKNLNQGSRLHPSLWASCYYRDNNTLEQAHRYEPVTGLVPSSVWWLARWRAPLSCSTPPSSWHSSIRCQSSSAQRCWSSSSPHARIQSSTAWMSVSTQEIPTPHRPLLHWKKSAQIKCNESLTSLRVSPRAICSCSSFCSSLRAPMDCWLRAKSESSFSPASVKYLEKCSQLRLLAGKSSC